MNRFKKLQSEVIAEQRAQRQPEAFCLMTYECEECKTREQFWNSRNGVTPFVVSGQCLCGGDMKHVDWGQDQYAPNHIPLPGQGIFVDTPASLILPLARFRCQQAADYSLTTGVIYAPTEQRVKEIAANIQPGTPWFLRWP